MRAIATLLMFGLGASLLACSDDAPRCGTMDACDIRQPECQAVALRYAVCLRARNEAAPSVPVLVQSRTDFLADRVARAVAADTPAERSFRRGLALFRLGPASSTPDSETRASYRDVVAIFSGSDRQIVIIDDGRPLDQGYYGAVLVHEYVHALQHAAGELDEARSAPRFDARIAQSAIIEGEATIAQDETITQGYGFAFDSLDYGKALRSYRDSNAPSTARSSSTPYDDLYPRFSYAWGASYLWPLRDKQGAAAIASAHAALPVSSYAVLELDASQPTLRPDDLGALAVPVLPNLTLVSTTHLGRVGYAVFREVFPRGYGLPSGPHFVADTLSVFRSTQGTVLALWRFRFDDPARTAEAVSWLQSSPEPVTFGSDDSDLWIVEAEVPDLLAGLPPVLTFEAAPEADYDYEPGSTADVSCLQH